MSIVRSRMGGVNLRLDWATHEAAKIACERWHYSGTRPTGKNNYIGVWERGAYVGCLIFGLGASSALGKPYGLGTFEVCELVRVALKSHETPVTRIVSIGMAMMKRKNPGIRLCVSFADPFHGHHGGIYQGGNWVYSGTSSPSWMWKIPDGSLAHERRFSGVGWNAAKTPPVGSIRVRVPGKHRYLFPLDDEMRSRIEPLRKPYPKRAGSSDSGTSPVQGEGGGSIPTPALSSSDLSP